MENEYYRDNLEQILKFTQGKQVLNFSQVSKFTGIADNRTLKRMYPFTGAYISAATLARAMCGAK